MRDLLSGAVLPLETQEPIDGARAENLALAFRGNNDLGRAVAVFLDRILVILAFDQLRPTSLRNRVIARYDVLLGHRGADAGRCDTGRVRINIFVESADLDFDPVSSTAAEP